MDSFLITSFCILLCFGLVLLFFLRLHEHWFLKSRSLVQIDKLSGPTFEKYLCVLFQARGYHVMVTPDRGDFGADLIVTKDGVKTAIQAKRYRSSVGISAVQEVVAAKLHYGCQQTMVITNSTFTPAARKLAKSNNVSLIDRNRLGQLMEIVKKNE